MGSVGLTFLFVTSDPRQTAVVNKTSHVEAEIEKPSSPPAEVQAAINQLDTRHTPKDPQGVNVASLGPVSYCSIDRDLHASSTCLFARVEGLGSKGEGCLPDKAMLAWA